MKCSKCQFENRDSATFCGKCRAKLSRDCPQCKTENPPENEFCDQCGGDLTAPTETAPIDLAAPRSYTPKFLAEKILTTRSAMEGERKLVTVLFADVAGFTSLSEKLDPEEVHGIMDGCFKILMDEIHRYEGTVNPFTGDGVMALFGALVAHEDHAQRACHAALAIQTRLKAHGERLKAEYGVDFKMRIGLNSGPVVVGRIGDDLRMDYTAVGDTTNLASRMESLANPGTILTSTATHRLVKDYFEFHPLCPLQVKGKEEPQEAFELLRAGEVATRIKAAEAKGLTRFVGRRNSMAAFMEAYEAAQSGSGQVVDIVGEAGVGKSRLLLEFRSRLPQGDVTYLEGRCLHYGGSMSYLPILDMLRSYLAIEEGEQEDQIRNRIEEKVLSLDDKLKTTLLPLYELLSLKIEDPAYLQLDPEEKKQRTFEALRDLFVRLSLEKPLVLAVEDLHWIDRLTEQFIDYLIGWLPNARILLILLHRPEYTHQWGSKSYCVRIGVNQLSTRSSAELVCAILEEKDIAPEIRELILSRAGGNPLFVEELTHSLLENGSIYRQDDRYVLSRKASEIQVPETIQGVIAARIDRVEENLKGIMQVASVIGREFAFRILHAISGMAEDLKAHLTNLQGLEFIYEKSLFPELEYIFKHALTQEVVYGSLLLKRRKEIHERIAQAIESLYADRLPEFYEALAYHYGRSDNGEKAVDYLYRAMQRAFALNAVEQAKVFFDEAMRVLDALPESEANQRRRIAILVENQGYLFMQLFKMPEFDELLKRHRSTSVALGDPLLLGSFLSCVGFCQWWFGRLDDAVATGLQAVEMLETSGHAAEVGYCYWWLQWCYMTRGDLEKAIALKPGALLRLNRRTQLFQYVYSLSATNWAYAALGQWDNAVQDGRAAIEAAEELSNNSMISFAAMITTNPHRLKGDLPRALEYGELASQRASTVANRAWAQGVLEGNRGLLGEPLKAAETVGALLPLFRSSGFVWGYVAFAGVVGELYRLARNYEKASQVLKECQEISERCGMKYFVAITQRLLGEVAMKTDPTQAAGLFEKSMAIAQEIKAENELALCYAGYGRLLRHRGRIAEARDYLTRSLEILDRLGTLIEPDKVRQELPDLPLVSRITP